METVGKLNMRNKASKPSGSVEIVVDDEGARVKRPRRCGSRGRQQPVIGRSPVGLLQRELVRSSAVRRLTFGCVAAT